MQIVILLALTALIASTQSYPGYTTSLTAAIDSMLSNFTLTNNPLSTVANLNTETSVFTSQALTGSIVAVNATGFANPYNIVLLNDAVAQVYANSVQSTVINFYSLIDGSFQTQLVIYSGTAIPQTIPKIYVKGNTLLVGHKHDSTITNLYMSKAVYNALSPSSSTIVTSFVTSDYKGQLSFSMDESDNVILSYRTTYGTYVVAYGTTTTISNALSTTKNAVTAYNGGWTLYAYTTTTITSASDTSLTLTATTTPPTGYVFLGVSQDEEDLYYQNTVSGITTVYDATGSTLLTTTDNVLYFDGTNAVLVNSSYFTVLTST